MDVTVVSPSASSHALLKRQSVQHKKVKIQGMFSSNKNLTEATELCASPYAQKTVKFPNQATKTQKIQMLPSASPVMITNRRNL